MKLSFFTMPIHPVGKPVAQSLKEDREAFLLADSLEYAEAYCGEHTTDQAEIITSTVAFLASLAYETKQIRLGTGTVNMPNSHPARIAAEVAMLDHMLEGRLNFGISPGGLMSDAEVFGSIEAVKTVSDLFMPVSGEITSFNDALEQDPEVVNKDPYGDGWLVKIEMSDTSEVEGLLSPDQYKELIG